jgi:hypothetical protein
MTSNMPATFELDRAIARLGARCWDRHHEGERWRQFHFSMAGNRSVLIFVWRLRGTIPLPEPAGPNFDLNEYIYTSLRTWQKPAAPN